MAIPKPLRIGLAVGAGLLGQGCTFVKPIACALVFPVHQFGEKLDRKDGAEDEHDELPTAGVAGGKLNLTHPAAEI